MKNFEIRILLRHYWKQEFEAAEAVKKICEMEGKDAVSVRISQKWLKKFNKGHTIIIVIIITITRVYHNQFVTVLHNMNSTKIVENTAQFLQFIFIYVI